MTTLSLLFIVVAYLFDGLALMLLWEWFMTITFGLPAISFAQAVGIGIIINILTHQHIPRDDDKTIEMMYATMLLPLFAIIIGWIVHLFL